MKGTSFSRPHICLRVLVEVLHQLQTAQNQCIRAYWYWRRPPNYWVLVPPPPLNININNSIDGTTPRFTVVRGHFPDTTRSLEPVEVEQPVRTPAGQTGSCAKPRPRFRCFATTRSSWDKHAARTGPDVSSHKILTFHRETIADFARNRCLRQGVLLRLE